MASKDIPNEIPVIGFKMPNASGESEPTENPLINITPEAVAWNFSGITSYSIA